MRFELEQRTCFCFDRDETVSTGTPPGPIPIEVVRYISHDTNHPVWATGNQALTGEADINGRDTMIEDLPNHLSVLLKNGGRRDMVKSARRLSNAEKYVVIDDVDLSDMEGVTHYYPEEFLDVYEIRDK